MVYGNKIHGFASKPASTPAPQHPRCHGSLSGPLTRASFHGSRDPMQQQTHVLSRSSLQCIQAFPVDRADCFSGQLRARENDWPNTHSSGGGVKGSKQMQKYQGNFPNVWLTGCAWIWQSAFATCDQTGTRSLIDPPKDENLLIKSRPDRSG